MEQSDIIEGLRTCELFCSLDEYELQKLAASLAESFQVDIYKAGDAIFAQHDHITRLYVIIEGQVILQRTYSIGDRMVNKPVALLGKGRAIGWSALLHGCSDATASAVCQKPTRVISIESTALHTVLEKELSIGFRVIERLACLLGDRLLATYDTIPI